MEGVSTTAHLREKCGIATVTISSEVLYPIKFPEFE
jgi:hypothetical protein